MRKNVEILLYLKNSNIHALESKLKLVEKRGNM